MFSVVLCLVIILSQAKNYITCSDFLFFKDVDITLFGESLMISRLTIISFFAFCFSISSWADTEGDNRLQNNIDENKKTEIHVQNALADMERFLVDSESTIDCLQDYIDKVYGDGSALPTLSKLSETLQKEALVQKVGSTGYEDDYTGIFVGMFPAESPQYLITVVLDKAQIHKKGLLAYYAEEAFGDIASQIIKLDLELHSQVIDSGRDFDFYNALAEPSGNSLSDQSQVIDSGRGFDFYNALAEPSGNSLSDQ